MTKKNNIKQIRTLRGIQQKKMALDIGVAQPIISRWENNINQPDIESLKKVANYLECSIEDLLVYSDDNNVFTNNNGITGSKIHAGKNITISMKGITDNDDSVTAEIIRIIHLLDMREKNRLLSYAYEILDTQKKSAPGEADK